MGHKELKRLSQIKKNIVAKYFFSKNKYLHIDNSIKKYLSFFRQVLIDE